jgi:hypothetical protein
MRTKDDVPPPDWSGAGPYLLPLKRVPGQPGHYEVAAIPASPGFEALVYRVYPGTEEVLAQYRKIEK